VIDGEAVICDTDGKSDFDKLHSGAYDARVFLHAFDLIELDGEDLRLAALELRKRKLEKLLAHSDGIRFSEHLDEDGPAIFAHACTAPMIAARQAAGAIPIIMAAIADPVAQGFVQSLARPGGNITGFAVEEPTMGAKWVELLKEIALGVGHITAIFNPSPAPFARMFLPSMEGVRTSLSFEPAVSRIRNEEEVESAMPFARDEWARVELLPSVRKPQGRSSPGKKATRNR
jgi:hypothetical protein